MKRIILMLTVAAMMVVALAITAPLASAASCPGINGCKTTDNPDKRNDGFTSSNTGKSPVHECNSNPSGKCK